MGVSYRVTRRSLQDGTPRFCKPFEVVVCHEAVAVHDYAGCNLGVIHDIDANNLSDVVAIFYLYAAGSLDNHHPIYACVCASYACARFGKLAHHNNVVDDYGTE